MIKKLLLFLILFSLLFVCLSAKQFTEIKVRFSTQEGTTRIVFEGIEEIINNLKVIPLDTKIRIEFPEPIKLSYEKELPFKYTKKDRILVINFPEEIITKYFRLSYPPRLVLDILNKASQSDEQILTIISNVFVIDPGHGGYDFGIISERNSEKDVNLFIAKGLGRRLLKKGKRVFYTRKVDQYISIRDRIKFVNKKMPDVFISIHTSMSEDFVLYSPKFQEHEYENITDYYDISSLQKKYLKKSIALSDCIEDAIEEEFKVDAVRREMPLPLLNSVGAPSVLIEFPSPMILFYDIQLRERIENALLKGIALYGLKQIQMDVVN